MLRRHALRIAIVPGGEPCALAEDLADGLAARGHRVRVHPGGRDGDFERLSRRLRAEAPDVVSQHACDPAAFAAVEGLPVLHTLSEAPSEALVEAAASSRAWFAAPSAHLARAWRAAGLPRVNVIPAGVPDGARAPAVVRPLALVTDRPGAFAALRAGLGLAMLHGRAAPRRELARKAAHCAVCIAGTLACGGFDELAAQAQLAGCPVVGYAFEPLAEIVEPEVSGLLVEPGDELALAAAVRRAVTFDRHAVRESARRRLALEPMLDRYESELRAIARRSAVRLVA